MGTVRFGNDNFTAITGYGDYNLEGEDLLTGSCDSNLYTISISKMAASSPVCLCPKPRQQNHGRKANVQYFYVFGSLLYPKNDRDDLGKIQPIVDIGIFVGYSDSLRGFRIYNHQMRKIMETIHVKFDELTAMASKCNNSGPGQVSDNSAANTLDNEDTPSSSSIIVEDHDAP
ncbi:hypothetical protein Tco_1087529 [Tanacetum coccineum]